MLAARHLSRRFIIHPSQQRAVEWHLHDRVNDFIVRQQRPSNLLRRLTTTTTSNNETATPPSTATTKHPPLAAAAGHHPTDSASSGTPAKDVTITSDGGSSGNHPTSHSSSSDWRSFLKLSQYVWPSSSSTTTGGRDNDDEIKKDDRHRHIKTRVVASLGLMVAGKAVTIQIPFVFKHLVDTLPLAVATATATTSGSLSSTALFATDAATADPVQWALVSTLAMYGISRAAATGLQEYRNVVFAVVAQDAIRTVGRRVFDHLLSDLDLSYHISRSTGQLARVLDRGQRSINFVLNAMVFHIGPTILEVSLVTGLVLYQFGWAQASVVVTTVVAYTAFTFASNER
jgi:hypothetical protein